MNTISGADSISNAAPPTSPKAVRGWPPTPGRVRFMLIDSDVPLRQKAGDFGAIVSTLQAGEEADILSVKIVRGQKWIGVALYDGRRGFIPGDTQVQTFRNMRLRTFRTDMLAKPDDSSSVIRQIIQGERIMIMETINATPTPAMLEQNPSSTVTTWAYIRDANGQQGYIDGKVKIFREGAKQMRSGAREMITGAILCGGGSLVTAITYSAASGRGGGTYVIAWGAIIFGGWRFLRGFYRMFVE